MMTIKFQPPDKAKQVIDLLLQAGATDCLFVGGIVRDILIGIESKDIDIEVYGIDYETIANTLRPYFRVDMVGKSFGVIKVDNEIDLSLPRRETKTGKGHKGFDIEVDPSLTPSEALKRRDFTINSIGMRINGTIYDPYDGKKDIERKLLRATSDAFGEEPLRVLRGMQFVSRFGFDTDDRTLELCRSLLPEFETLSLERIWGEWFKWATKGRFPSKGLKFLQESGWMVKFPELAALEGCPQNPLWHPEGDVLSHTMLVCDAAAKIAEEMQMDASDRASLMFAALCHDFGKPACTVRNKNSEWVSPGHDVAGVPLTISFLNSIKSPNHLIDTVVPLVKEHMANLTISAGSYPDDRTVRRLANRLAPATVRLWCALCSADAAGSGGFCDRSDQIASWLEVAERLTVEQSRPSPFLMGRDLLTLGMTPGPAMGNLLRDAYEAQLDGEFQTHEEAISWAESVVECYCE